MSTPELDVRQISRLARLNLTEEEIATFQPQLAHVLEYVEQLGNVDVSNVEPTAHTHPIYNVFREDIPRPSFPKETVLANAPRHHGDLISVTKVVE